MDEWEQKMYDLMRQGHNDRVEFLEKLDQMLLPSQVKRIQQNDKTLFKEIVLPPWVTWEMLYEWSMRVKVNSQGRTCILCNNDSEAGMEFKEKFICDNCFLKLKNM